MVRTASLFLVLVLAGCSSQPRIVVGSKNFTEQVLLGEILAQHIEQTLALPVERKLNLGGTLLAHEAVRSGAIDLYPEYTGTALTAVLHQPITNQSTAVMSRVREGYKQWGLKWMNSLGFNNTFAMVVRTEQARQARVDSLSAAVERGGPWRLGVGYEFVQRPDGLSGLLRVYPFPMEGKPATMDLGLLYPALQTKKIDMAAANATDGQLARPEYTALQDDRRYFPPYECAVIVRQESLARFPGLEQALEALSGRISEVEMRRLNAAVDVDHRPPAEVAREFLAKK